MVASSESYAAPGIRAHGRALLTLGLPLIGSHVAQIAVGVTDTLMMGWYDVTALAGMTVAGAVWFVVFIMGSGFAWAVMPLVAAAAGTETDREVRRVTRMGLWLSLMFALLVVPFLARAEPLLLAMGQEAEIARLGALYLSVAAYSLIPNLLIMVMKSYFAALERTRVILWVTLAMAGLNAVLNYALIFGNWGAPELGIVGAAVASVTVGVVGLAALAIHAVRATPEYDLFRNVYRPDWDDFAKVFRLGWPIGLTNLAEVGLFAATSIMMGWIGAVETAAHGIALQITSVAFMVHIGLSQAVTVRAGRAFGRGDLAALRTGAAVGLGLSMAVVVLTMAVFLTAPAPLIGLFVDPADPAAGRVVAIGVTLLALAALFQLVDAGQVMALGMLRGVQDTRIPMLIAGVSYWGVGIPASYVLGFPMGLGAPGIWMGLVIGLALAAAFLTHRFWARVARV